MPKNKIKEEKKPEAKKKDKAFVTKKYTLLKMAEFLSKIKRYTEENLICKKILEDAVEAKNEAVVEFMQRYATEISLDFPMHGPDSRARNKIHKIILDRAREVEAERMEIVKKHAEKDKKTGEPRFDEKTGRFDIKDPNKFNADFVALMNEEAIFDLLPSNIQDWRTVKEIFINKIKSEMTVEDTIVYEEICQAFEAL